jgi:DNA-binding transcriptional LysR family regulator
MDWPDTDSVLTVVTRCRGGSGAVRTKLILSRGWVSERKRGRVALAVTPAVAAALLPATTRKFAECYPAIRLTIETAIGEPAIPDASLRDERRSTLKRKAPIRRQLGQQPTAAPEQHGACAPDTNPESSMVARLCGRHCDHSFWRAFGASLSAFNQA